MNQRNDTCEENSDDDSSYGRLAVSHLLNEFDIRRTQIEFGRCFLSGSISGGMLRRKESQSDAK